jgi:hypothetical protein
MRRDPWWWLAVVVISMRRDPWWWVAAMITATVVYVGVVAPPPVC